MRIKVLTLFPEMFAPVMTQSILGRANEAGTIFVEPIQIRDYTADKHRRCDDYPFGGGAGMVMTPQPLDDALRAATRNFPARRIFLSPRGATLTQDKAKALALEENLIFICGHYEGIDQRIIDLWVDEELSIGDYVLTGGELAAMVTIDALSRHVPGVLGSDESAQEESFMNGLLEYPQYTRPATYKGLDVPPVLLSGHHKNIAAWQREQMLRITREKRPDLFERHTLTKEDRIALGLEKPKQRVRKNRQNAQIKQENPCK